jgi:dUTP pyrophosphatase
MDINKQLKDLLSEDDIKKLLTNNEFGSSIDINELLEKSGLDEMDMDTSDLNLTDELKELGFDLQELEDDFKNYSPKVDLKFTKLSDDAVTPVYNYESDSGFDLHSTIDLEIPAFGRALVPTGLSFDINDGNEIQVRSKSGLALKQGLMVLNSPGTVDNGYTGEVQVIVFNVNNYKVTIPKGMKVAQAVLCPVLNGKWVNLVQKNKINEKERGENGFGSTGI